MKKIIIAVILGISAILLSNNFIVPKKEVPVKIISDEDRFKKDILESILEFVDEDTPIDSLYIPEWLISGDSIVSPM